MTVIDDNGTAEPTLAEMMDRLDRETRVVLETADILSAIEKGRSRRWTWPTSSSSQPGPGRRVEKD